MPPSRKTIQIMPGDAVIHIRLNGAIDVHAEIGDHEVMQPALTALGLYWSLENKDWRYKMTRRAAERVQGMVDEERQKKAGMR